MKIFAVLDVKAGAFMKLVVDTSVANAMRSFDIATNEAGSVYNRFPDDFALCELADFDPQTGKLTAHPSPLNLGNARTVLRQTEQPALPLVSQ